MSLTTVRRALADAFWLIPTVCLLVAAGLALGLVQVDEALERSASGFAFTGGPNSAREVLSTIASSMLTLTGLVFSITIVVLQLTSSQFSPRVLRTFVRDRFIQLSLGIFLATFLFALLALREVRGEDGVGDSFVPGVTISVGFVLVLVSVGTFVRYVSHIAQSIRVVNIIERITVDTEGAIADNHPVDGEPSPAPVTSRSPLPTGRMVASSGRGVVVSVDVDALVGLAASADGTIRVLPGVGDFVARGAPLCEVAGSVALDDDHLRRAVALGPERNVRYDVGFGFRQLVDVAEKALSPGVNDPTTATQCLNQIHSLLRELATRPFPSGVHLDDHGAVRLIVPTATWEDHVHTALDEIRHWGSASLQVHARLRTLLEDLLTVVPDERRAPLTDQLRLLDARSESDLPDVERALLRDRHDAESPSP